MDTINELIEFVKEEHSRVMVRFNCKNKSELRFPIMIKITEELGELSEAVLAHHNLQRKEKLDKDGTNVGEEMADVVLTTFMLAENMGIDMKKHLITKIEKNRKRV